MEVIDVTRAYGNSDSVFGTTLMPLSLVKYQCGRREAIRLGQLDQVIGEPSNHKVKNECTRTIDIEQKLEDSKDYDDVRD